MQTAVVGFKFEKLNFVQNVSHLKEKKTHSCVLADVYRKESLADYSHIHVALKSEIRAGRQTAGYLETNPQPKGIVREEPVENLSPLS